MLEAAEWAAFVRLLVAMREAQKDYYCYRTYTGLVEAAQLERQVDAALLKFVNDPEYSIAQETQG